MSQIGIEVAREAITIEHFPPARIEKKARRFNFINPYTWFSSTQEEGEGEEQILSEDEKLVAEIMGKFRSNDVAGLEKILENEMKNNGEVKDEFQDDEYIWIDEISKVSRKKSVRFDKLQTPARTFTPIYTSTPRSTEKSNVGELAIQNSTILSENSSINSAMKKCAPQFNYTELADRSRSYYNFCGDISEEEEEEIEEESIKGTFVKESPDTSCSYDDYPNLDISSTFVLSEISEETAESDPAPIDDSYAIQNSSEIFDDSYWTAYNDESLVSMRTDSSGMSM